MGARAPPTYPLAKRNLLETGSRHEGRCRQHQRPEDRRNQTDKATQPTRVPLSRDATLAASYLLNSHGFTTYYKQIYRP